MNNLKYIILPTLFLVLTACKQKTDYAAMEASIQRNFDSGNYIATISLADSFKKYYPDKINLYNKADSLAELAERISLDFSVTEDQLMAQLEKKVGPFTMEEKMSWENKGWLEWRLINGHKMYFNRAASNLFLLKQFYEHRSSRLQSIADEPIMIARLKNTMDILKSEDTQSDPCKPVNMKIEYTITVHPDVVPEGETIRCWLPWPKTDQPRQQKVELINTSENNFIIAPDSALHSTIYMESNARKGQPTVFSVTYSYQSSGPTF